MHDSRQRANLCSGGSIGGISLTLTYFVRRSFTKPLCHKGSSPILSICVWRNVSATLFLVGETPPPNRRDTQ